MLQEVYRTRRSSRRGGSRCASAGARQVLEDGGGGPGQLREVTGKEGGSGGARAESNWTAGGPGRRGTAAPVAMAVAPCCYRLKTT